MALPSKLTPASQLGEIHRSTQVVASSSTSHHGPDMGSVATSHIGGGAVWWKSVRRVTHGANCFLRRPEFKADDSEANDLPRPERARGQEPVCKVGGIRRCVRYSPATPARYGENWIVRTLMPSGGTPHSSVAHLNSDAIVSHEMEICSWHALHDRAMRNERIEGHEWGT
jgi:hypothetical protein